MSAVWIEQVKQSFERVTKFQRDNSKAKIIKAKIMEFITLDNQPFSVVGDVGFCRLVEHRLTLPNALFFDAALPELHSNSITAIIFKTYIWVFACQKDTIALSKLYKKVSKQTNTSYEQCVYNTALVIKHHLFDRNFWGS
jgi:hypothetical protein